MDDDEGGIRQLLGLQSSGSHVIGFDTEAKPKALYASERNRTALVQLASPNVCVMWRTVGLQRLPNSLLSILSDPAVVKVGQGIGMDARDIVADFAAPEPRSLVDLHQVACRLRCEPKSLQGLVGIFLKHRLLKDMRVSNWEDPVLRAEQIQYAALDAWASRAVYEEIRKEGLDVDDFGRVATLAPVKSDSPLVSTERPVVLNPPLGTKTPQVQSTRSAQVRLVEICVSQQLALRLVGFEKVKFSADQFKCVFEITREGETMRFESKSGHSSMRAAQEDAAAVVLSFLSPS